MIKKFLPMVVLTSILVFNASTAVAGEPEDPALTELLTPTLSGLYNKVPAESPIRSSYSLLDNSSGNFLITKYLVKDVAGSKIITPKTLSLSMHTLGNAVGTTTYYYKWDTTGGKRSLVTAAGPGEADLTVKANADSTGLLDPAADVNRDFTNASDSSFGGAISNSLNTNINITGAFVNNTTSDSAWTQGGAVFNTGSINNITGDFINNYISHAGEGIGGAIYNEGSINNLTGNFVNNYVSSASSVSTGGAIYNRGTITNLTGDFINNHVSSPSSMAYGGAIYNSGGTITSLTGDFINNYAVNNSGWGGARGGAIYNFGSINNMTGDFMDNKIISNGGEASGGAIYNASGIITNMAGDFINNSTSNSSGMAYGGAIYNHGTITNLTGDFINNSSSNSSGTAYGGAIYHYYGTITNLTGDFIDNHAVTNGGYAQGGAIFIDLGSVNLVAKDKNMQFTGNYISNDAGVTKQSNAVYLNGNWMNPSTLNLNADTGKSIVFNDSIASSSLTNSEKVININATQMDVSSLGANAPTTGNIVLNNDMSGYKGDVNLYNGTIKLGTGKYTYTDSTGVVHTDVPTTPTLFYNANSFNVYGGAIDFSQAPIAQYSLGKLTLNNNLNMRVKADLANESMTKISANSLSNAGGYNINVNNILLTSDANKRNVSINFADSVLKNAVKYTGGNPVVYSPIYKYDASYDPATGNFNFSQSPGGSSNPENVNPAVIASPVAAQSGAFANQVNSYSQSFQNMDYIMLMPRAQRLVMKYANRYAMLETGAEKTKLLGAVYEEKNAGTWFQPYTSFENISFNNGPKINNVSYGSFFGGDSKMIELKKGWDAVYSGYAGYNGSHQTYSGNSVFQNGGQLGTGATFYKGNSFTGFTANVGASAGEASTMYGNDNFNMLSAGLAAKTGYNFEFNEGKFIVQPSYMMSYTFVKTFDYTNAAGVKITSDPLNAIQIAPGIKFIANTKNGWQPYLGAEMLWNLMDKAKYYANDVSLPELSIKPYFQYGLGVQKRVGERLIGFGQAMVRNGGRTGIALAFGFRMSVGKDPSAL